MGSVDGMVSSGASPAFGKTDVWGGAASWLEGSPVGDARIGVRSSDGFRDGFRKKLVVSDWGALRCPGEARP